MNQEILSLRKDSSELQSVLMSGSLSRYGECWSAIPREVVSGSMGIDSVVFEVVRPEGLRKPSYFQILLKSVRFESLSITLMPCLSIGLFGILKQWEGAWHLGAISLLGVLFFQISVNILNDVEDHLRLIDFPGSLGGSGVIQKGWISAVDLKKIGYWAFVVGVLCGLPAVFYRPGVLLWISGAAALGVLSYSNRPFGLKYREIGDLSLFVLGGPLLAIGFSQALFGQFDLSVFLLGSYFGFATLAISHANNIQDMETDLSNGIRTLATKLGFKLSRHFLAAVYALAFLILWMGVGLGLLPSFILGASGIGAFWVIPFLRKLYKASGPVSALLGSLRVEVARIHFILGFLVCVSLMLKLIFI